MAKEKNLTAVTSVAAADFVRAVTSAGASVKATFANVAKYVVETYNGSTVAGSAQSVKSALDSLNSKWVVETKVLSFSDVAAGGTAWCTSSLTKSGYTAVCICGWYFTGSSANTWLLPYSMRTDISNSTASIAVRNLSTSSATGLSLTVEVLYRKN